MKNKIATIGIVSHCCALSETVMRKIAEMPCAQGEVVEVEPEKEMVIPVSAREIEPYTPVMVNYDKPSPVYDYKRIKKARRK